jgi:two-component system, chemotaxis family, protein-glutamate methylesterase/glutaminase
MFSTLTEKGAITTLEALSLGASDYVAKPSNSGSVENTKTKISAELIPRTKALCTQTIQGVAPARVAAYLNKVSGTLSDARPSLSRFGC